MKLTLIVFVCISLFTMSCKRKPKHKCLPPKIYVTDYKTVFVPQIDTLVIIQTYDTVPYPKDRTMLNMGYEVAPIVLFKDGKRSDTIERYTRVYR